MPETKKDLTYPIPPKIKETPKPPPPPPPPKK
jgi:hypothetical protein